MGEETERRTDLNGNWYVKSRSESFRFSGSVRPFVCLWFLWTVHVYPRVKTGLETFANETYVGERKGSTEAYKIWNVDLDRFLSWIYPDEKRRTTCRSASPTTPNDVDEKTPPPGYSGHISTSTFTLTFLSLLHLHLDIPFVERKYSHLWDPEGYKI